MLHTFFLWYADKAASYACIIDKNEAWESANQIFYFCLFFNQE